MLHALIIEDNKAQQNIYDYILKEAGFRTFAAYNGEEAIEYLEFNDMPQLIILDIKMPQVNGVVVLDYLKGHPDVDGTHIIIATSTTFQDYKHYEAELPSVEYALKPESVPALRQALKRFKW